MNITLNYNEWSYQDLHNFAQHFEKMRMREATVLAQKVIVGDVVLNSMSLEEGAKALRTIFDNLGVYTEDLKDTGYTVDLSGWTWSDFSNYTDEKNPVAKEAMLCGVARLNAKPLTAPLSLRDGLSASRVLRVAVERVFSGKN